MTWCCLSTMTLEASQFRTSSSRSSTHVEGSGGKYNALVHTTPTHAVCPCISGCQCSTRRRNGAFVMVCPHNGMSARWLRVHSSLT